MFAYLDIETIPSQRNEAKAAAAERVKRPGNISRADTIATWEAEKRPVLELEEYLKTALNGAWGEIVCICWAFDDGPILSATRPTLGTSERELLEVFHYAAAEAVRDRHGEDLTWCGHCLTGFDLRFIWQRSVMHQVKPQVHLHQDRPAWDPRVVDTNQMWCGYGRSIKLTELCQALNIDVGHEDTIDGSQVWDCYQAGEFETILAHCKADVARVRAVHRALTFASPPAPF